MPDEPDLATVFDELDDGSPFDLARAREGIAAMVALAGVRVPVDHVESTSSAGVPTRTYRHHLTAGPTLVWLHGGGWISGGLETADDLCRDLAVRSGLEVVSVDYRLAPENPFPAALLDAVAVLEQVAGPVVVGGDSAGAGLAAAACLLLRDRRRIAVQVLVSPLLDATLSLPSVRRLADGHGLTLAGLERCVALYAPTADPRDPRLSPLHAPDLAGLPPAVVVSAGRDPLLDEAEAYAARLLAAGVPVRARRWEAMVHGFHAMPLHTPCAGEALDWVLASLQELLRD